MESECGTKPEFDDVEKFLRNIQSAPLRLKLQPRPPSSPSKPKTLRSRPSQIERSKIVGFILRGKEVNTGTARGTLAEILIIFDREDPEFMKRFATETVSRTRNLVARNRVDLYEKSHLVDKHSQNLGNGWWLGINLSAIQVRRHIETACSVAGIRYGSQLKTDQALDFRNRNSAPTDWVASTCLNDHGLGHRPTSLNQMGSKGINRLMGQCHRLVHPHSALQFASSVCLETTLFCVPRHRSCDS